MEAQIEQILQSEESSSVKKEKVFDIRLQLWIMNGVCRYGLCWVELTNVANLHNKIKVLPTGYFYPSLLKSESIPSDLEQVMKRKERHDFATDEQ